MSLYVWPALDEGGGGGDATLQCWLPPSGVFPASTIRATAHVSGSTARRRAWAANAEHSCATRRTQCVKGPWSRPACARAPSSATDRLRNQARPAELRGAAPISCRGCPGGGRTRSPAEKSAALPSGASVASGATASPAQMPVSTSTAPACAGPATARATRASCLSSSIHPLPRSWALPGAMGSRWCSCSGEVAAPSSASQAAASTRRGLPSSCTGLQPVSATRALCISCARAACQGARWGNATGRHAPMALARAVGTAAAGVGPSSPLAHCTHPRRRAATAADPSKPSAFNAPRSATRLSATPTPAGGTPGRGGRVKVRAAPAAWFARSPRRRASWAAACSVAEPASSVQASVSKCPPKAEEVWGAPRGGGGRDTSTTALLPKSELRRPAEPPLLPGRPLPRRPAAPPPAPAREGEAGSTSPSREVASSSPGARGEARSRVRMPPRAPPPALAWVASSPGLAEPAARMALQRDTDHHVPVTRPPSSTAHARAGGMRQGGTALRPSFGGEPACGRYHSTHGWGWGCGPGGSCCGTGPEEGGGEGAGAGANGSSSKVEGAGGGEAARECRPKTSSRPACWMGTGAAPVPAVGAASSVSGPGSRMAGAGSTPAAWAAAAASPVVRGTPGGGGGGARHCRAWMPATEISAMYRRLSRGALLR